METVCVQLRYGSIHMFTKEALSQTVLGHMSFIAEARIS